MFERLFELASHATASVFAGIVQIATTGALLTAATPPTRLSSPLKLVFGPSPKQSEARD